MSDTNICVHGLSESETFEHFNFATLDIVYRGRIYSTKKTWAAIEDIHQKTVLAHDRLKAIHKSN
jgi:hypothetical protein